MSNNPLFNVAQIGEEAITYLAQPNEEVGYMNLGSAELYLVRSPDQKASIVITTSSGDSVRIPVEALVNLT